MRNSLLFAALMGLGVSAGAAPDPTPLYQQHCVACHGADRLGGMGPALLPQNLERLKKPEALSVIAQRATGHANARFQGPTLSPEEIQALADFIYTPPAVMPQWGEAEIRARG
jgi:mono/diheme cytochrome c family protein